MPRATQPKSLSRHRAASHEVRQLSFKLPVFTAGQWVWHRNERHMVQNTHLRDCELYLYLVGQPHPVLASEVQAQYRTVTLQSRACRTG